MHWHREGLAEPGQKTWNSAAEEGFLGSKLPIGPFPWTNLRVMVQCKTTI